MVNFNSEYIYKKATNISREKLLSLGTCFGKFTKTGKFKLHITCLDYLAKYCNYKIWLKNGSEQSFLYGNHVLKAHLSKISEDVPEHTGIVIYSSSDKPLGFGTTSKSSLEMTRLEPTSIIVYNQADVGEYLRQEDTLI